MPVINSTVHRHFPNPQNSHFTQGRNGEPARFTIVMYTGADVLLVNWCANPTPNTTKASFLRDWVWTGDMGKVLVGRKGPG